MPFSFTPKPYFWYSDGQYQGGTPRGWDCVNLFDPDTNLIAVYQEQPDGSNLFLTTCRLTPLEVKHLKDTNGNFLLENDKIAKCSKHKYSRSYKY